MTRPNWDEYFLAFADTASLRADCSRRKVGAVVVKNNRIVSTGYNGAPAGDPGCLEGACPRGQHGLLSGTAARVCRCGAKWPCSAAALPGSDYANCISVHAEANALLYADRDKCEGATIYITDAPCFGCEKLIRGAGIARIVVKGQDVSR